MKKYILSIFLGLSLATNVFAQTEVRRAPLAVSNDDGTNLSYPWKVTFTSGVTDNSNGTASISVVNVHAHGEYTAAHATATAAASGFMPALSGFAADYLNGTGAWSIPSGTSLDHQHPNYTPLSDYSTHAHSQYSTTGQLGEVANQLGTHQHNTSYPSASQFQQLYSIATTNQHDTYYADIEHQHTGYQVAGSFADSSHTHPNYTARIDNIHPEYTPLSLYSVHAHPNYQVAGSFANATHNHSNYTPFSDFATHQHNASYPGTAQFQQLYSIATTNQHDIYYADIDHQHSAYQTAGSFADASHIHPNYTARIDNTHPEYTPLSLYSVHTHSNYQVAGSFANATHNHSNYTPLSDFTTHQHNTSYATVAQNQAVAAIATTNTHAVATPTSFGFVLALPNDATRYWDGSGAYSVPAGSGTTGHLHPFYTPLSDYGTHAHPQYSLLGHAHATVSTTHVGFTPILPNVATQFLSGTGAWSVPTSDASPHTHTTYVPYTGANSTVNLGAQHLVAETVEFDGTAYITGNTGIGKTPQTLLDVNNRFLVNSTSKTLTDVATQLFEVTLLAGAMTGGTIIWTIEAGDAMDWQSLSGITTYAAVNNAGSYYTTVNNNTANDSKALSSGTLTTVWDILTGTNKVIIRVTPTGSLTETIYRITYTISNNNSQAITIL